MDANDPAADRVLRDAPESGAGPSRATPGTGPSSEPHAPQPAPQAQRRPPTAVRFGLSARLLTLTVLFVMLAEVLIYVPSIANFRLRFLQDRLASARLAALVLDAAPAGAVPPELERRLVSQVGALTVAMKQGGARRLIAVTDMPPEVHAEIDLRNVRETHLVADAFQTLAAEQPRYLRVVGPGMEGVDFVEIVLDESPLRDAMLDYSVNILLLSLVISAITAVLVYATLHRLIVQPVRRLTTSIMAFEERPEAAVLIPGRKRTDEIGLAERALGAMQRTLADELRQKKHLADLGLAVSKINHDLRNMLASAQLFSDRLSSISDPTVQRFAPKLITALDRAIAFCQATLAYGRAAEPPPMRRRLPLVPVVEDLRDALGLWDGEGVALINAVPTDLEVDADPEQLSRVLVNLGRNAKQALSLPGVVAPAVTVSARRRGSVVTIDVADNGPGIPEVQRLRLFKAFQTSGRDGGTGLGLTIAAELVSAHGGRITVLPGEPGAVFRIEIPDQARQG
jgi:signal transduction histidine kinase